MANSFLRRGLAKYTRLLEKHPFRTQVGLSTAIAVVGDLTCQVFSAETSISESTDNFRSAASGEAGPLVDAGTSVFGEEESDQMVDAQGQPSRRSLSVQKSQTESQEDRANELDLLRTARFGLFRCFQFCVMVPWLGFLERRVVLANSTAKVAMKIALDQLVWTPPSMVAFYTGMAVLEGNSLQDGTQRARKMLWPTLSVNWPFWTCTHVFSPLFLLLLFCCTMYVCMYLCFIQQHT